MKILSKSSLPTNYGTFTVYAVESKFEMFPHLILMSNTVDEKNVRIHSECMTGDVFASAKCDCGEQLDYSMEYVAKHGGLVMYLRQEGRGIGLVEKLKAYALQDTGLNTIEANLELGHKEDDRTYELAGAVLKHFEWNQVNLMTNNPNKINGLTECGIIVNTRIPVELPSKSENEGYLKVKKEKMGHLLKNI